MLKRTLLDSFDKLRLFVRAKLGRCPRCMRLALRGAIVGWISVIAIRWIWPHSWYVFLAWPLSFTALWLVHMLVFGSRAVRVAVDVEVAQVDAVKTLQMILTRRNMLRFVEATAVAIAASAVLPRLAWAKGADCASDDCKPGWHLCSNKENCCPDAASYDCLEDSCDPKKSHKCYADTDDNRKYLLQCCKVLIDC